MEAADSVGQLFLHSHLFGRLAALPLHILRIAARLTGLERIVIILAQAGEMHPFRLLLAWPGRGLPEVIKVVPAFLEQIGTLDNNLGSRRIGQKRCGFLVCVGFVWGVLGRRCSGRRGWSLDQAHLLELVLGPVEEDKASKGDPLGIDETNRLGANGLLV